MLRRNPLLGSAIIVGLLLVFVVVIVFVGTFAVNQIIRWSCNHDFIVTSTEEWQFQGVNFVHPEIPGTLYDTIERHSALCKICGWVRRLR